MGASSSKDRADIRAALLPEIPLRGIGVFGLGHVGDAFASNLVADGYRVTVYDEDEKRAAPLVAAGASGAAGMKDFAARETILSKDGLVHVLAPGAIHVCMSTVSPDLSRRLVQQHKLARQGYVAAPVLGNPDLAHARKLFVIAAGEPSAVTKIARILERLGQRLFLVGEDAGTANLMKLACNVLTALTL
jgi:3-hydroxyisobutyrate dehydrogenase-like beta-hydroxyacid dehydrogenase